MDPIEAAIEQIATDVYDKEVWQPTIDAVNKKSLLRTLEIGVELQCSCRKKHKGKITLSKLVGLTAMRYASKGLQITASIKTKREDGIDSLKKTLAEEMLKRLASDISPHIIRELTE